MLPTPVPMEEPIEEDPREEQVFCHKDGVAFVEDDLPFEEPDVVPVEKYRMLDAEIGALRNRIDELLMVNEELMAVRKKDKEHIAWLEVRVDELGQERHILEKQLEIVQLIFGRN